MAFHLSPASLVDQRGSDYPSLLLVPNSGFNATAQAFGNFSLSVPLNATIPQIFVVNPSTDNIFRHVNTESAHAAIIGLIYYSMWMGALGWDIVSTISFDVRIIKETTWSSRFSSIYSIAYLLSRYVSLSWLVTAVTNSVIMTDRCDAWMKGSTALFSVAISATMLVFCLRTCSIWHMQQKIVSLVVSAWFLVVAFALLLPVMSYGDQLPTSKFCSWHFNGLYVVGVFGALLLFDLLCLILTVCKLNKAGWRGLLHGLFPSGRHNLDAEDVKTMLVQKTTAFFALQFLFLTSALLVYVLTDTYAYRMMNIVASVAVASSMAGRIFRRAWRQTRELAPHNINRPPSYFPAWAEEHREAAYQRTDTQYSSRPGTGAGEACRNDDGSPKPLRANRTADKHDSLTFYVEGEYRPHLKARSMSSQSMRSLPRTPVTATANQQLREMEAGHASGNANSEVSSITPSTIVIGHSNLIVPTTSSSNAPAPAYSRRLGSAASSRPHTGDQDTGSFIGPNDRETVSESFPVQRASNSLAPIGQNRLGTAENLTRSMNGSLVSFASLGDDREVATLSGPGGVADRVTNAHATRADPQARSTRSISQSLGSSRRDDDADTEDRHHIVMEERRRTFITSPPLAHAIKINNKEVYDVESVKAAARAGGRNVHRSYVRPATASSLARSPAAAQQTLSGGEDAPRRRCDTSGGSNGGEAPSFAFSLNESHEQSQSTPRPKTAPSLPSPSLSPSNSEESQMTIMPRDFGVERSQSEISLATLPTSMPADSAPEREDDVLLAFLQTVDQDSRERARSHPNVLYSADASKNKSNVSVAEDGRPRTAKGNTVGSAQSDDDAGAESDFITVLGHTSAGRGRRASSSVDKDAAAGRPQSAVATDRRKSKQQGGAHRRVGTGDSSRSDSSGNGRPATAVGDAVKPFGHGQLLSARRGSRIRSLRADAISDEDEAEPELGSVIQQQYAKLAARAQMPLDPPY